MTDPTSIDTITNLGGTITTSGDYTIHTFTSSGTFEITKIKSGGKNTLFYAQL